MDQLSLAATLHKRFGPAMITTSGGGSRLDLELTGRRWRGVRTAADSAPVVASYLLAHLPTDMVRPDTVAVRFRTRHLNLLVFRSTSHRGDTIVVNEL